jgi:hypothetical protein
MFLEVLTPTYHSPITIPVFDLGEVASHASWRWVSVTEDLQLPNRVCVLFSAPPSVEAKTMGEAKMQSSTSDQIRAARLR